MVRALQLPAWDARFIYLERAETPPQVMSVYVFGPNDDGPLDVGAVVEHLIERASTVAIFRRRLLRVPFDVDHPYWVDAGDFSLSEHVTTIRIDPGWNSLSDVLAELSAQPVDLRRPPWHLHVVHGLAGISGVPDGSVAIVQRIHHSASDGLGAVNAARQLLSSDPLPPQHADDSRTPSRPAVFALAVIRVPVRLGRFVVGLVSAVVASRKSLNEAASGQYDVPKKVPRTRINDKIGRSRTFDASTLQLANVRAVKQAIGGGVTVNDVMLSVIGGALVKYLAGHDGLPDESLAAMVPKSISDNREGAFGNHFTSMIVSLRTDVNDPVDRARAIRRAVESEVRRKDSRAVQTAERFAERIPGFVLRLLLRTAAEKPADSPTVPVSTVVSNVPRGAGMELFGVPALTTFGPLGLDDGQGLVHLVSSIGEVLTVSVTADPALVPDLDRYVELIRSEFEGLARQLAE